MSEILKEYMPMLRTIACIRSKKARKDVLKQFSKDPKLYKALREVAKNIKAQNIKLTNNQKQKLRKEKKVILSLAQKGNKSGKRKNLVIQSGHGLLLPIAIPLVASLIETLIRKYGKRENDDVDTSNSTTAKRTK